jgi:hypothetical protein
MLRLSSLDFVWIEQSSGSSSFVAALLTLYSHLHLQFWRPATYRTPFSLLLTTLPRPQEILFEILAEPGKPLSIQWY